MDDDPIAAGLAEIAAIRLRLAEIEAFATQQAQSPPDAKPGFDDALRRLARDGTAAGPGIDALRRQVAEGPALPESPDPGQLAEATRSATDFGARPTIEEAYSAMKARASRLDVIESTDPGASGRADPSDPSTAKAIVDRILKGS